jgi:hypothetical protein
MLKVEWGENSAHLQPDSVDCETWCRELSSCTAQAYPALFCSIFWLIFTDDGNTAPPKIISNAKYYEEFACLRTVILNRNACTHELHRTASFLDESQPIFDGSIAPKKTTWTLIKCQLPQRVCIFTACDFEFRYTVQFILGLHQTALFFHEFQPIFDGNLKQLEQTLTHTVMHWRIRVPPPPPAVVCSSSNHKEGQKKW